MSTTGNARHSGLHKAFRYESADIAPGLTVVEYRRRRAESRVTPRRRRVLGLRPRR
jgi:hypothetical protein